MRVVIFTTNTGQGHNCASSAVKERLDERGVDTLILDALNSGKERSKTVSRLYDNAVNHVPALFGALYTLAERISSSRRHSPIYYLNAMYADSLYNIIKELAPQVIVCPHMFSAHAVTRIIDKYGLCIPTVGIITDYTCSPFWEETRLNGYIVAAPEIADECVSKGMDRDKLYPIGIPVSGKFKKKLGKSEARAAFGITSDKAFAVVGGSMGYGRIYEIAGELVKKVPDAQVVAVCGHNREAYEKVKKLDRVTALKYIDNLDALMDAVDVFLTKPGGLSATEAMMKRVPLVITMPIPGGEVRNAEFIARMGMAVTAYTPEAAADAACKLISDENARTQMIAAQRAYCSIDAAEEARDLIIRMAESVSE